jgi:polysaccharide biosynthesis/export protein
MASPRPLVNTDPPLREGDQIEVFVTEDSAFNGTYAVRGSGDVILPKIGRLGIRGLTVRGAEGAIKRALERTQLKVATVIVDRPANLGGPGSASGPALTIFLSGQVARAGQHRIVMTAQGLGVYEAIMSAGGTTKYADEKAITVTRRGNDGRLHASIVDLAAIKAGKRSDFVLQEGDSITVGEKNFVW